MRRREFLSGLTIQGTLLGITPSFLLAACNSGKSSGGAGVPSEDATLRIIHTAALSSLDPVWTTAPGTREYGFLVFDQLIALDSQYKPRPQMAEGWDVEDSGRSYVFSLRDGLKFHDNEPVRSADCIASIKRWRARDGFGTIVFDQVDAFDVIDDRKFRIRLKAPLPVLPLALAKISAPSCLIMPERMADTDPNTQVTEYVGSGPFKFLKDEWNPGSKAAWERFDGYVPRREPPSGLAGGKVVKIKRVEWTHIPDPSTALSALQAGEQDLWDIPPSDLQPLVEADSSLVLGHRNGTNTYFMLQPNHQQAPFDKLEVRQALAMAIDQLALMKGISSQRPKDAHACASFYAAESPYYTPAGSDLLQVKSMDRARQALARAGYSGEKVLLMAGSDSSSMSNLAQIIEDILRRMGMNAELVLLDFASLIQRRTNHGPFDKGGWSLFLTGWVGADILDPLSHPMLRGAGNAGYPGWCVSPEIEDLRGQWARADEAGQMEIAHRIQQAAFKVLPYIPLGTVVTNSAWQKSVTGDLHPPYPVYWDVEKNA